MGGFSQSGNRCGVAYFAAAYALEIASKQAAKNELDDNLSHGKCVSLSSINYTFPSILTQNSGLISSILRFRVFLTEDVITDTTWATADLAIWTVVEPGMYFIAACLIKLRPLVKNVVRRASMSFPGRKSTGSDGRICIAKDSNQSNAT